MVRALIGLVLAIASIIGLLVIVVAFIFLRIPDVRMLKGCLTTELYHVHLCDTDPNYVPFSKISPYIPAAVIMSEDGTFYSHNGVDLFEMKESFKRDLSEGRFARGASTITQQLAKNVFLSKDKSLTRKVEEIYLALQIEKYFTKQKILTDYLNVVEFGPNMYGIKKASEFYFKKLPEEIAPEEAAFLAFLLPNPKKYSQSFHKKQLTPFGNKMVRTILLRMYTAHKISEIEYHEATERLPTFLANASQPVYSPTDVLSPEDDSNKPITTTEPDHSDDDFNFDFDPNSKDGQEAPPPVSKPLPAVEEGNREGTY